MQFSGGQGEREPWGWSRGTQALWGLSSVSQQWPRELKETPVWGRYGKVGSLTVHSSQEGPEGTVLGTVVGEILSLGPGEAGKWHRGLC